MAESGTPESSIGVMSKLGMEGVNNFRLTSQSVEPKLNGVAKLPENQYGGVPTPEFKAEVPEIKNLLDPGEQDNQRNAEREFRSRQYGREGQTSREVLLTSSNPDQIVDAARNTMSAYEDMSLHRDGTSSDYVLQDTISALDGRSNAMGYDRQTLASLGYIDPDTYNAETTEALFAYPGFAFTTRIEMRPQGQRAIYNADGSLNRIEVDQAASQVFLVGTDQQREALSNKLKDVQSEMVAREDLVKMLRYLWAQTENLDGLVNYYLMGSLTNEAMRQLCDAEGRKGGLTKTEGGVEYRRGHEFGDAMGAALQCFEIAAASEDVKDLEGLLKRPGTQLLFNVTDQQVDDLFLQPGERANRPLNQTLVNWIGEPWQWHRGIGGVKENVDSEQNHRGLLTKKGNILVEGRAGDIEFVSEQVERFLGGGPRSRTLSRRDAGDARFIAWGLLRTTGMASDLGGQVYKQRCVDGVTREVMSHDLGGMTSCDRVKVYKLNVFRKVYSLLKPEIRNYGPEGSLDKYPDRLTVPYFKQWTARTENGKRTFQEMRWGYRQERITDLTEGVAVAPAEKAHRLGELPWRMLSGKAYNAAALGPYIAGRDKVGIFNYVKRTDYDIREIKDMSFSRSLANWLGIAFNEQTVYDGKLRGVYNGDAEHDRAAKSIVTTEIREYKKKFIRAWWDGLRSLPQWREWQAMEADKLDSNSNNSRSSAIDRAKFRFGRVGILTPDEADALPTDFYHKDEVNKGGKRAYNGF